MKRKNEGAGCPCGGKSYATCCEPYHQGKPAETAEKLMRSRYSAYAKGLWEYVYRTWDARTRPGLADLQGDRASKWLGLEVRRHEENGNQATVEFVARYKIDGKAHRLHEVSRFEKQDSNWVYVEGSFPERAQ
ncbi:MAG TPA: YchJ family metal-binding protein [Burkholderiaceae bacterium]